MITAGGRALPSTASAEDEVERALSLARRVGEGGPYSRILGEHARREAARIPSPGTTPDLGGVTVAVKEMIAVEGLPQRAGSAAIDGELAGKDSPVVSALRRRGAIVIGTTAMHELAFGVTGINTYQGTPKHPTHPAHVPGGSSSGSAVAVAAGSARLALGTDTGGSVRIPAALCGVVGLKPAHGELPTTGVLPLSPSLDHVGLLGCSIDLISRAHKVLHGGTDRPLGTIGVAVEQFEAADRDVVCALDAWLRDHTGRLARREVVLPSASRIAEVSTTIMFFEAARTHGMTVKDPRLGSDVRARLQLGGQIPLADYRRALDDRRRLRDQVHALLDEVDVVIGPTVPITAPALHEAADPDLPARLVANTRLANVTGIAALSIPVATDGLPVGLQIQGPHSAHVLSASKLLTAGDGPGNATLGRTIDR